ncbi:MAG TPA: serine/threonine-protein kinase [Polyangiaceae bacterium]|nr:serine/threonine-protein kinase [Polyangiaceae bacterium]
MLIDGVVRLVRLLGQGGMGSVWAADHLRLGTQVAVKFLSPALATEAGPVVRFQHEAMSAAQIKSPHVVQIFDHGVFAGERPYIVMELLEGEDLGRRLERAGPLGLDELARVVAQVCRALAKAHAAGIVHRDLKPDNIFLLDQDGELFVKVLDFGVAKRTNLPHSLDMTDSGLLVGTPNYMSPEQVLDLRPIDQRADLWALGVVAYRCLLGRVPFEGSSLGAVCVAIERGVFEPPSRGRADVPPELDAWFAKALSRDPAARFGSAREMAEALATACALGPSRDRRWSSPDGAPDSWYAPTPSPPSLPSPVSSGRPSAPSSLPSPASSGRPSAPSSLPSPAAAGPAGPPERAAPVPPAPSHRLRFDSPSSLTPPGVTNSVRAAEPPSPSSPHLPEPPPAPVSWAELAAPAGVPPHEPSAPHRARLARRDAARWAAFAIGSLVTATGLAALVIESRATLDRGPARMGQRPPSSALGATGLAVAPSAFGARPADVAAPASPTIAPVPIAEAPQPLERGQARGAPSPRRPGRAPRGAASNAMPVLVFKAAPVAEAPSAGGSGSPLEAPPPPATPASAAPNQPAPPQAIDPAPAAPSPAPVAAPPPAGSTSPP